MLQQIDEAIRSERLGQLLCRGGCRSRYALLGGQTRGVPATALKIVTFEPGRRLPTVRQVALRLLRFLSRFLELLSIEKHRGAAFSLHRRRIVRGRLARELMLRVHSQAHLRSFLVLPRHWQARH